MQESEPSLVFQLNHAQIDQLVNLYAREFWCQSRTRPYVDKMLVNSDIVIGLVDRADNLIGFVRVLTDYVYKATIYDLIVHQDWRSQNLGRLMVDAIIGHPSLREVEHFDLHCLPDMYAFYEKWNFTHNLNGLGFMRRYNREG